MNSVLYSIGDSVVWGAELTYKLEDRFTKVLADKLDKVDCNNASSGVSNDYIFRHTMRDVSYWLETGNIWSEDIGWTKASDIFVIVGWTAPTRFEWWDGERYVQERLWAGYDKWGGPDEERTTEDEFILFQTEQIPSYIRTMNQVQGLSSFLTTNNVPFYFFNAFYEYFIIKEPKDKIDLFGRDVNQVCFESLYETTPITFRTATMYSFLRQYGGKFSSRKHPDKDSHKMWADFLYEEIKCI